MDPLTQGLLGATTAYAVCGRRLGGRAALAGFFAGLLADADVFIRSDADPLLAIEYHRHFTHALAFIPLGAVVATLPWLAFRRQRADAGALYGASFAAYATHGLLDACTTYGTQLLWPFSSLRVAWHLVAVIDPVFTVALLVGLLGALFARSGRPAVVALSVALLYLGVGALQRERALDAQAALAASRGHAVERVEVFPTLGNNVVWRSLYQIGDTLYSDRIRVGWLGDVAWTEGESIAWVGESALAPELQADARVMRDFRRFAWFSDGWTARAPDDASLIGDVRYSLHTQGFDPVWGVSFQPGAEPPTRWIDRSRDRSLGLESLWQEIAGHDPGYLRLDL